MDLQEHAERFFQSKTAVNRSAATLDYYRYHIGKFLAWCAQNSYSGNDLVGTVGAEVLEEYFLHLGIDYSPFTVTGAYRSLRALYRFIEHRQGPITEGNPYTWLEMPSTPDLLPKAITFGEFMILLHNITGDKWIARRDRLLIKMLFFTGLRLGEITDLSVNDVNLERRQLRIYRQKIKAEGFIPLSQSLRDDLRAWLGGQRPACPHDGLWPSLQKGVIVGDQPLIAQGITEMLRRRCRTASLPEYLAHSFRHGCAVHIIQRGGDLSLVKDLLGHRDLKTTQHYLRFDLDRLTNQYDRIFE